MLSKRPRRCGKLLTMRWIAPAAVVLASFALSTSTFAGEAESTAPSLPDLPPATWDSPVSWTRERASEPLPNAALVRNRNLANPVVAMSETAQPQDQPQRPLTATKPIANRPRSRGLGALLGRFSPTRPAAPVEEDGESVDPAAMPATEDSVLATPAVTEITRIRHLAELWKTHPILEEADLMYQDLKPITEPGVRDWVKRTCGDHAAVRIRPGPGRGRSLLDHHRRPQQKSNPPPRCWRSRAGRWKSIRR